MKTYVDLDSDGKLLLQRLEFERHKECMELTNTYATMIYRLSSGYFGMLIIILGLFLFKETDVISKFVRTNYFAFSLVALTIINVIFLAILIVLSFLLSNIRLASKSIVCRLYSYIGVKNDFRIKISQSSVLASFCALVFPLLLSISSPWGLDQYFDYAKENGFDLSYELLSLFNIMILVVTIVIIAAGIFAFYKANELYSKAAEKFEEDKLENNHKDKGNG